MISHSRTVVKARESLGLTQSVFATLLDVSQPTVSAWESKKANPTAHQLSILKMIRQTSQTQERKYAVSLYLGKKSTATALFIAMGGTLPCTTNATGHIPGEV